MIRIETPEQARRVGAQLAATRGIIHTDPASLLDMPPMTVADARSVLLLAARHGAEGDFLHALLRTAAREVPDLLAVSLFADLTAAMERLDLVDAGLILPVEVLDAEWTEEQTADGQPRRDAIERCEQDAHELLVQLVPDGPLSALGDTGRDDTPLPGW